MSGEENPFVSEYKWFIEEAKKNDITLILDNGMRAGCIKDSLDYFQFYEFKKFKEFSEEAIKRRVGVIAGVIDHTDPSKIERLKQLRNYLKIPLGGLGPLLTDIAMGYDHINASIGIVYLRDCIDWVSLLPLLNI